MLGSVVLLVLLCFDCRRSLAVWPPLLRLASVYVQCGEEHFQEAAKTVSDMNEDLANKELREGRFMRWDEPLPTPNATLLEYDKLAHNPHDVGMFRAVDYDSEGELEEEERLNVRVVCCLLSVSPPCSLVSGNADPSPSPTLAGRARRRDGCCRQ